MRFLLASFLPIHTLIHTMILIANFVIMATVNITVIHIELVNIVIISSQHSNHYLFHLKMIFPLLLASFLPIRTLILPKIIESKYLQVNFSTKVCIFSVFIIGFESLSARCWTGCILDIQRLPRESTVCRFLFSSNVNSLVGV